MSDTVRGAEKWKCEIEISGSSERELHFSVLSSWRNLTRPPALHALPPCFASAEVYHLFIRYDRDVCASL